MPIDPNGPGAAPKPISATASRAVNAAKGLAIGLVIVGHYGPSTLWPAWYARVCQVIYLFHMPLFMMLAGMLAAASCQRHSGKTIPSTMGEYWAFVRNRSVRLMVPYLSLQVVYFAMKLGGQVVFRYHPPSADQILAIVIRPESSYANILWFLYSVWIIGMVYPLLRSALRSDIAVLVVAAGLSLLDGPTFLTLDYLTRLTVFYALGYTLLEHNLLHRPSPLRLGLALSAAFACLVPLAWALRCPMATTLTAMALTAGMGALGSLAVLYLALAAADVGARTGWVEAIGVESAVIYLYHQPFVWAVAIALYYALHLGPSGYIVGMPVALVLGLAVPMLIDRKVLRRVPVLDFLFTGGRGSRPQPDK